MPTPLPFLEPGGRQKKPAGGGISLMVISAFFTAALAFLVLTGAGMALLWHFQGSLPSLNQLENIEPNIITKVYSADGLVLKEFYTERRIITSLETVPRHLINAVLAIEDRNFYAHWGLNLFAIPSAVKDNLKHGSRVRGASTITQQLARNLFLSFEKTYTRKIKEALLSLLIERTYTKTEILQFYVNQIYLGAGCYGFQAAARKYFNKNLAELSLGECAALAGMLQRPEKLRPDLQNEEAGKRRNVVLRVMAEEGCISEAECRQAQAELLLASAAPEDAGLAPYFVENIRKQLEAEYGAKTLYNAGLKVYSTLQSPYQEMAETAVRTHVARLQKEENLDFIRDHELARYFRLPADTILAHFDSLTAGIDTLLHIPDSLKPKVFQASLIAVDNKTGAILAMVGGTDFNESKFNRATQAYRQPGSAFKPFVYAAAFDNGYTPASVFLDQPITLETPAGPWRPENYSKDFEGPITLRRAFYLSKNLIAIALQAQVGTQQLIRYATRMGLEQSRLPAVASLAIGSCQATLLQMTAAYTAFPNNGVRVEPFYCKRLLDRDNHTVQTAVVKKTEVLSPQTAYLMCSLMQSVIQSGTGFSAISGIKDPDGTVYTRPFTRPAGGKTGTTNEYTDAWFIGFTPQMTAGVWVGLDDNRSMGENMTGSKAAVPLWSLFMTAAHENLPVEDFITPPGMVKVALCREGTVGTKKIARATCNEIYTEIFAPGTLPDSCDLDHSSFLRKKSNIFDHRRKEETGDETEKKIRF